MKIKTAIIMGTIFISPTIAYHVGKYIGSSKGERIWYNKGFETGAGLMLDTMTATLRNQVNSDTTVTKLVLINPDTQVFYLSPKHIK